MLLRLWSWQGDALVLANLATLAAFILVGLLLAVSPLGVFLTAMYPDSLFLALVVGAWLTTLGAEWRIAGIFLGLAIITRPFGIALALALLYEFARQRQPWHLLPWLVVQVGLTVFVLHGGWLV